MAKEDRDQRRENGAEDQAGENDQRAGEPADTTDGDAERDDDAQGRHRGHEYRAHVFGQRERGD